MATIKGDGKTLIMIFVGLIMAIVLLISISDQTFLLTNEITVTNATVTVSATSNLTDINGRTLVTGIEIYNATNASHAAADDLLARTNITFVTNLGSTGLQTVQLQVANVQGNTIWFGQNVNVSYTAEPDGFLPSTADRSIILLVVLFGALATLIFVIVMLLKNDTSFSQLVKVRR